MRTTRGLKVRILAAALLSFSASAMGYQITHTANVSFCHATSEVFGACVSEQVTGPLEFDIVSLTIDCQLKSDTLLQDFRLDAVAITTDSSSHDTQLVASFQYNKNWCTTNISKFFQDLVVLIREIPTQSSAQKCKFLSGGGGIP